jgi:hypothetical protein
MRYCPNLQCPFVLRHGRAAEYVDAADTCSDCGTALTRLDPPSIAAPRRTVPPHWSALGWTLPVFAAPFLIPYFRLPGLSFEGLPEGAATSWHSPFAMGVRPFLIAFLLVELAALTVPRWRPLRIGGPSGRARLLSAVWKLAYALCFLQALFRVLYMQRAGFMASSAWTRLAATVSLVAGTSLLVLLTQLVQRKGVGGGFSVLCAALLTPELVHAAYSFQDLAATWPLETRRVIAALVAVAIASLCLLRWRPRDTHGIPWSIRLPACGLVPLTDSTAIVGFIVTLDSYLRSSPPQPDSSVMVFGNVALVVVSCFVFGILFNRPQRVATASAESGRASSSVAVVRGVVGRAVGYSAAFVIGLRLIEFWIGKTLPETTDTTLTNVVPLIVVSAVALDIIEEVRAIARHGVHVAVWPEHRVYAVDPAVRALERAGIPAFPRSVHQRALWHFFAPYIPIEIMVPVARASEAAALLHETLLPSPQIAGRSPAPAL